MSTFKKNEILICVNDENSGNKLIKNKTYIVDEDSFIFKNIEYVSINIKGSMFYINRFVNIQKLRKQKLQKISEQSSNFIKINI